MRVERTSRGLHHCFAQCRDCGWSANHYVTAARKATTHVRQTGHTVDVDQGITYAVRPLSGEGEGK